MLPNAKGSLNKSKGAMDLRMYIIYSNSYFIVVLYLIMYITLRDNANIVQGRKNLLLLYLIV